MNKRKIICNNCQHEFFSIPTLNELVCPKCQSTQITIYITIEDKIKVRDQVRGKAKDDKFSGKRKIRGEFIVGSETRGSDGKWVHKERIIDKENNRYKEVVIDEETGEIIHECDEPLKKHQGHGTAKFTKGGET
jgi:hypothetical protein